MLMSDVGIRIIEGHNLHYSNQFIDAVFDGNQRLEAEIPHRHHLPVGLVEMVDSQHVVTG